VEEADVLSGTIYSGIILLVNRPFERGGGKTALMWFVTRANLVEPIVHVESRVSQKRER
jgi:hypothetical protein